MKWNGDDHEFNTLFAGDLALVTTMMSCIVSDIMGRLEKVPIAAAKREQRHTVRPALVLV